MPRVRHPNVVTVYGAERIDGRVGMWMELVEGRTLEDELGERGPFPPGDIVAIGAALCSAVAAVHAAGLLHRDIKAHNVMRGRDGRILLADFGTGRDVTREGSIGELAGTPLYLAPELLEGEPASVASDVYSLGVLLYHLATRAYPVCGRSVADLREAFLTTGARHCAQRRPDIPTHLAAVVERAIDPVPSRRHDSAASLGSALAATTHTRRRVVWSAVAALLVVATVAGLRRRDGAVTPPTPRFVLVSALRERDRGSTAGRCGAVRLRARTDAVACGVGRVARAGRRHASLDETADGLAARRTHRARGGDPRWQHPADRDRSSRSPGSTIRVAGRSRSDVSSGALVAQATVEVADIDAAARWRADRSRHDQDGRGRRARAGGVRLQAGARDDRIARRAS